MSGWPGPDHNAWEGYTHTGRMQLQESTDGKLRRAIGRILPGESREELEIIAALDQCMARAGLVELQNGERVFYKHIDALTREDSRYRLEAERTTIAWLRGRIEGEKVAQALEEDGRDLTPGLPGIVL